MIDKASVRLRMMAKGLYASGDKGRAKMVNQAAQKVEDEIKELKLQLKDAVGAMKASKSVVIDIDEKYGVKSTVNGELMSVLLDESINESLAMIDKQ